jgi:hypothetical protein
MRANVFDRHQVHSVGIAAVHAKVVDLVILVCPVLPAGVSGRGEHHGTTNEPAYSAGWTGPPDAVGAADLVNATRSVLRIIPAGGG